MESPKKVIMAGTDNMFQDEYHIFQLIVRKRGIKATMNSGLGASIPNRSASKTVVLKIGTMSPPQISIKYAFKSLSRVPRRNCCLHQISQTGVSFLP